MKPLTPERSERLKNVALTGTAIALAGIALKNNKVIGEKIRHVSVWGENQQTFIIDLITKGRSIRLSGALLRNSSGEVIDVDLSEGIHPGRERDITALEAAFREPEQPS